VIASESLSRPLPPRHTVGELDFEQQGMNRRNLSHNMVVLLRRRVQPRVRDQRRRCCFGKNMSDLTCKDDSKAGHRWDFRHQPKANRVEVNENVTRYGSGFLALEDVEHRVF